MDACITTTTLVVVIVLVEYYSMHTEYSTSS